MKKAAPTFCNVAKRSKKNPFKFRVTKEQDKRALQAPYDNSVVENLHGTLVSDPFRPLEDLDAPETAAWLKRESAQFNDYIANSPSTASATDFMMKAYDYDKASLPLRYEDTWFRTFQEGLSPQGVVQTAKSAEGPWETILDPNTLSTDGTVALSSWYPSPDGKRVAYLVSEAGSDAETLQIYDVEKKQTLPDRIENARFTYLQWDKDSNAGFNYTYPTHDGTKNRKMMHHDIGAPVSGDKTVIAPTGINASASVTRLRTARYEWAHQSVGTDRQAGLSFRPYGSDEPFKEIVPVKTMVFSPVAELEDGTVLAVTMKDAPRGKLVRFDPKDAAPEKWQTVIPEHPTDLLEDVTAHQGKLLAFYKHDTAEEIRVFTEQGQHLYNAPLPPQSVASVGRINPDDEKILMKVSGFQSMGDTYSYDAAKNELAFVKKSDAAFDLKDAIVERLYATSKDGTKVPMTVIRGRDTKLDGSAALKLYGYGGFRVSLGPTLSPGIAHWVKEGGIYAQVNLRGGGEFGDDWFTQGRRENKQNVFDDFAAAAEYLIENKYSGKGRIVANGGSNGGLLTSVAIEQRPDLFGAVVTEVPVTDMFRFHIPTYGGSWMSDYGDPGVKKDFEVSSKYSPLHNVEPCAKLPPHLIKTADHDDRVVPWHAFKLAATLQARSHPANLTLLRVEDRAGHGAGKPTAKIVKGYAETFAFIEKAIGPVNQKAYKAQLAAKTQKQKKHKQHKAHRPH